MSLRATLILTAALCLLVPAALAAAPASRKLPATPTVINLDTDGYSTEGTALAGHFRGPTLDKVVARHYGETGKCIEEYTFTKGQPTFLLSTLYRYNGNIGSTSNLKVASTTATRYYFTGNRLTRCIEGSKSVALTAERRKEAAGCLTDGRTFAKLLQKEKSRREQLKAARSQLDSAILDRDLIAIGRHHGIDYPATVRRAMARDPQAMHSFFVFAGYTDGGPAEVYEDDLVALLIVVGDKFFAASLAKEPAKIRANIVDGFLPALFSFSNAPNAAEARAARTAYPKTYALAKDK